MTATIELPSNKIEIAFILEVLKRLNVRIIEDTDDLLLSADVLEDHAAILRERRAAMSAPDAQFFSWEEAQTILANRKIEKAH
jgi:hypothetical protein